MRASPETVKIEVLLLSLIPVLAGAASSSLQFVPTPNSVAQGVTPMANGSVAVFGATTGNGCAVTSLGECDQTETPLLSILNASGNQTAALASSALGGGNSSVTGVAVDANGNFWITGETDSDDFPLIHALFTQKTAYKQAGFVAKLDPSLNILFSTFLGGYPALGQSSPVSIALDGTGNAYVVGSTNDPNFPTSGPVIGVGAPSREVRYTFVVKISSDGSHLLFSHLMGGDKSLPCLPPACVNGVNLIIKTVPFAIAVDSTGNLTVVGATEAMNFPITANVYTEGTGAFVSRISADGSQLIWSTELGIPASFPSPGGQIAFANSVALDAANNVYVTGFSVDPVATSPGALESPSGGQPGSIDGSGFAAKLSSDATQLLFATGITGTLTGVALDAAGNAWITGNTNFADFPGLANVPSSGLDFALELNSDATALRQIFSFLPPTTTQPPAFDSNGNLLLLAAPGNLVRLNAATALTAPAVFAVTNSAVPKAAASMAPGELVTLYGVGLGPVTGISGAPDQNGIYPTQLDGVTVEIGGVPAPLLYAGTNQINLQVPFFGEVGPTTVGIATPTTIAVTTPVGPLPALQLPVAGSIGIFGVLNEDGSVNSPSNGAPVGSIVSLYLTGLGAANASQNGAISPSANSAFLDRIEVYSSSFYNFPLRVLYAGTAPDLINGLDQVNVQLPAGVEQPELVVQTLALPSIQVSVASNIVTVYTRLASRDATEDPVE